MLEPYDAVGPVPTVWAIRRRGAEVQRAPTGCPPRASSIRSW